MDNSVKYRKMCEKAKEIQRKYIYEFQSTSGDWIYCKENNKIVVLYFNKEHGSPPVKYQDIRTVVWLPRQDQLQEMIKLNQPELDKPDCFVKRLFHWTFGSIYWENKDWEKKYNQAVYAKQFDSMEQLWLAFVMWEKYNKVWNDEKEVWI